MKTGDQFLALRAADVERMSEEMSIEPLKLHRIW